MSPEGLLGNLDAAGRLDLVPALAGLSAPGREALARLAVPRSFARDEPMLVQGIGARSFFVLISGRAKMCRDLESGRGVILALFGPGDLFGTVSALGGQACDASVVAIEDTFCLEVRRDDLFRLFQLRPDLVADILPVLTRPLVECKNCIVELTCYRVEARFALLFLKLAASVGRREPEGVFVPVHLSRQELADLGGTTIETCIRVMSRWSKEGVLETRADGFLVRDAAALERLGQG